MKTSKLGFETTPHNVKFEIESNENQQYSINIISTKEIAQYIENLSKLLPITYPNVHLRSNGKFYTLWSENPTELITVVEALIDAIYLHG
ncbi:hypothetical protein LCGC14_0646580 [marine sediment metagenome]|uniref:Uncharacterized protein n=1 Tax=marine sediment metagenome TaxID=412755 RepID=A0A0F9R2R2_9ZZZZ|nr:MAG: hypothetical protein Lokiarch_14660 [Candidatus Lokiarchaeum sp. GC14_75]HEC36848.1 hypothetical protein [bacterium]